MTHALLRRRLRDRHLSDFEWLMARNARLGDVVDAVQTLLFVARGYIGPVPTNTPVADLDAALAALDGDE